MCGCVCARGGGKAHEMLLKREHRAVNALQEKKMLQARLQEQQQAI